MFLLLLVAFAGAELTTLFFHDRTLTVAKHPVPQLVCKNTVPDDGCQSRRIEFADCKRAPGESWSEWVCSGAPTNGPPLARAGLQFKKLDLVCETDTRADSCSLTYTLEYTVESLEKHWHAQLAEECNAGGYFGFGAWVLLLLFGFHILLAMIFVWLVAIGRIVHGEAGALIVYYSTQSIKSHDLYKSCENGGAKATAEKTN